MEQVQSQNCSQKPKETTKVTKSKALDGRTLINNKYKVVKRLGEGSLSIIKLVENQEDGKLYGLKQYNKTILQKKKELIRGKDGKVEYRDSYKDILGEVEIMKKLNHPNIIKLVEIINDPEYPKLYLIIDYCEKGSIIDWDEHEMVFTSKIPGKNLPEEEIARILTQIIIGLEYLHNELHVVHRDIKPQNILETADGTIKIADYDIAVEINDDVILNKTKGTLHFMAPELCKKTPSLPDCVLGYTADLWSLGVTLYCLTYLKLPFMEKSLVDLINAIETKPHFHLKSRGASEELKDLVDSLMEKNPTNRLSLAGMKKHKFFEKYGIKFD